jgi:hypothetical protein
MRSVAFRALTCGLILVAIACSPTPAPGIPPDFQRPTVPGGRMPVVRPSTGDCDIGNADAAIGLDASQGDAGSQFDDGGFDSGEARGCAIDGCDLGFLCCPFDGRCNPPGCTTCCPLFSDGGLDDAP